ncbi:hypothetical protein FISHEDRAFT_36900 [Fistulina hepatica ATCC 64428]|uniref:Uncharacterized protein n=1 Tax=Fistulina hepatica ATCC 64428 TaxID=1128425 RepID=A0A0D7AIY3_9AGAR|nr:hypothetical protein FISHEDRAFT_36900 [Fistulina hepatica ATCC 64428]
MIWSSAQPHSVSDMVSRCFEGHERDLAAIWARDTLGLTEDQYYHKAQTTKNLAKPWAELSISEHVTSPQRHSASTTLLLDDSPLKARLQPWNHACIREYVEMQRQRDLEIMQAFSEEGESEFEDAVLSLKYDETLLAVIGVLDALKHESNVASWLRKGGLFHPGGRMRGLTGPVDSHSRTSSPVSPDCVEPGKLWFDDEPILNAWVLRGKAALRELDIPLTPGLFME